MLNQTITIFAKDESGSFVDGPPIAPGDFQISLDGGPFVNLATLPATSAGTPIIDIVLSAAEIAADKAIIRGVDQTAVKAWADNYTTVEQAVPTASEISLKIATDIENAFEGDTNGVNNWNFTLPILQSLLPAQASQINNLETKAQADTRQAALAVLLNNMPTAVEAALLNEGDGQQLIDAIVMLINSNLDLPSLELAAIANAVSAKIAFDVEDSGNGWDDALTELQTVTTVNAQPLAAIADAVSAKIATDVENDGANGWIDALPLFMANLTTLSLSNAERAAIAVRVSQEIATNIDDFASGETDLLNGWNAALPAIQNLPEATQLQVDALETKAQADVRQATIDAGIADNLAAINTRAQPSDLEVTTTGGGSAHTAADAADAVVAALVANPAPLPAATQLQINAIKASEDGTATRQTALLAAIDKSLKIDTPYTVTGPEGTDTATFTE